MELIINFVLTMINMVMFFLFLAYSKDLKSTIDQYITSKINETKKEIKYATQDR